MGRDPVDFFEIRQGHGDIHSRLLNWARCVRVGRGGGQVSPMFRGYRQDNGNHDVAAPIPVNSLDGWAVEKLVVALPEKHRTLVQWYYVYPVIPVLRVRKALGLTTPALYELLHDARAMLRNRAKAA
jgi:hypothetical protein